MQAIEFGVDLIPYPVRKIIPLAKTLEENNFDYLWVADVDFERDVYLALALIGYSTTKIKIGTGVTNPLTRHPVTTAIAISTLSELTNGRVTLALGTGDYHVMRMLNILPEKPLRALKEATFIIRELLANKKVSFEGTYFKIKDVKLSFENPFKVSIFIAGKGPKLLRLAGKIGDGVYLDAIPYEVFPKVKEIIRRGAESEGRKIDDLYLANVIAFAMDKDHEKAVLMARKNTIYALASLPEYLLNELRVEHEIIENVRRSLPDFDKAEKYVPIEVVEQFSISGTPEECIEKIDKYHKEGLSQVVFILPPTRDPIDVVKEVNKKIISYFKE